jgi:hypothetical protein
VSLRARRARQATLVTATAGVAAAACVALSLGVAAASGTWTAVSSPSVGSGSNRLHGVICASPRDCWAVGSYAPQNGAKRTLIERDTGSGWTVVNSPNVGSGDNDLFGVACPGIDDCWAVGWHFVGGEHETLIERDTGSGWTVVNSPNVGNGENELYGVACSGPDDCWAVGHHSNGGHPETLIEQNTGSGWGVVDSPDVGNIANLLYAVACPATHHCWAVGEYSYRYGVQHSLIEGTTGSGWAVVGSPNPGSTDNLLEGVACSASADCWAVGSFDSRSGAPTLDVRTLVEQNTGSGWQTASSSDLSGDLAGVTCVSTTKCWAVGSQDFGTLIEQSTGNGWSVVSSISPNPAQGISGFVASVTCTRSGDCWAVGSAVGKTLIATSSGTTPVGNKNTPNPSPAAIDLLPVGLGVAAVGGSAMLYWYRKTRQRAGRRPNQPTDQT